ncbi:hypothetical protein LL912_00625 [Niabella sp. CC-SYL272]|uniref:hypothetical protein n=1 Tax=Niabella agricola TaxID=2891571 RepID=UPI001F3308DD|nr:hypothetical protein [Niabella agricola]MCF3107271.1 hypothetical protein [Niabella agricola]
MNKRDKLHIKDDMPEKTKRLVKIILHYTGGNVTEFSRVINTRQQYVSRVLKPLDGTGNYPRDLSVIEDGMKSNLKDLDFDWYLTGKGTMILSTVDQKNASSVGDNKTIQNLSEALLKANTANQNLVEQNGKILDRILLSLDALVQASLADRAKERSSGAVEHLPLSGKTTPQPLEDQKDK